VQALAKRKPDPRWRAKVWRGMVMSRIAIGNITLRGGNVK